MAVILFKGKIMQIDIQVAIIGGVFGLLVISISAGVSWWIASKRTPVQNAKDEADTTETYMRIAREAGKDAAAAREEVSRIMRIFEGQHSIYAEFHMQELIEHGRAELRNGYIKIILEPEKRPIPVVN